MGKGANDENVGLVFCAVASGFILGGVSIGILNGPQDSGPSGDDLLRAQLGEIRGETLCAAAQKNAKKLDDFFTKASKGRTPEIVARVTPGDGTCGVVLSLKDRTNAPAP